MNKLLLAVSLAAAFGITTNAVAQQRDAHSQHQAAATHNEHNAHTMHHTALKPAAVNFDDSLYHFNANWQSQRQQQVQLSQFQGKPLLISMIYGNCRTACPLLVLDAKTLVEALPAHVRADINVVFVSFDHERDQPQALAKYAERVGALDNNWHFLHGDANDIRTLAALLGIRYNKNDDGNFNHSNVLTVLDQEGRIAARQEGLRQDPAPAVARISQLMHH